MNSSDPSIILEAKDVSKYFGTITALENANLTLKSGEVFAKGERADVLTLERMELLYENKNFEEKKEKNLLFTTEVQESNPLKKKVKKDQDAVILMNKVNVGYGKKVVLKNFNWTVRNGENWKIVGPNGSGKTTLFNLLLGIVKADSGQILACPDGKKIFRLELLTTIFSHNKIFNSVGKGKISIRNLFSLLTTRCR